MFLQNETLTKWVQRILKVNLVNRPNDVFDQISLSPNRSIVVVSGISDTGLNQICAQLIANLSTKNRVVLFNYTDNHLKQETFDFDELTNFLRENNNTTVFINEVQNLLNTKVMIRQFKQLSRKYNCRFYLFFNQIGLLYTKFFHQQNCDHYFVNPVSYNEWLQVLEKRENSLSAFSHFLNTNGSLVCSPKTPNHLAVRLCEMVEQILRHDVYELHTKKYSIHVCLQLLHLIAYAQIPVFNFVVLATHLKLDVIELHEIIRILSATKIIRSFCVYSKDLKRVNPNEVYLVFADPMNYGLFAGINLGEKGILANLRIWISVFASSYKPFAKMVVLKDEYVPYDEQVSLFDLEKQMLLQTGIAPYSQGPMLVYLQNKNIKKTHYFQFKNLLNFLINWSNKTNPVIKLN